MDAGIVDMAIDQMGIQKKLTGYRPELKEVFLAYASKKTLTNSLKMSADETDVEFRTTEQPALSCDEFLAMLHDANLVGSLLPVQRVFQVFVTSNEVRGIESEHELPLIYLVCCRGY